MEVKNVVTCEICGYPVEQNGGSGLTDERLCPDCQALHNSAQRLMDKSSKRAIYYFMDLFMRARNDTLSPENQKNCPWNAWWNRQKTVSCN